MKKSFSLAILGVLLAIPAHAQQRGLAGGGSGPASGTGGGGIGAAPGRVAFPSHTPIPPKNFLMIEFSGTETVTSTFLPFDKGILVGQADLESGRKTMAQVAMENRHTERIKAKVVIEQDGMGNLIIHRL